MAGTTFQREFNQNTSPPAVATAIVSPTALADYTTGDTGAVATPFTNRLLWRRMPEDFGAVGDGTTDDTAAFQKALNATLRKGRVLCDKPGSVYRITDQLTFSRGASGAYAPGPRIEFCGRNVGKILYDFTGTAAGKSLLLIDGASAETYKFFEQGFIRGLHITAGTSVSTTAQRAALEIIGWWLGEIEGNIITAVNGDAILLPRRNDVDANPDAYASAALYFKGNEFSVCTGWGLNGAAGLAFDSARIVGNRIVSNQLGGLYLAGHKPEVRRNTIASNGKNGVTDGPGIMLDRVDTSINSPEIRSNELDNNRTAHIDIRGGQGIEITGNRMNSWETIYGDAAISPPVHVTMAHRNASAVIRDVLSYNNYHRSQWTGSSTPATQDWTVTGWDLGNDTNVVSVDIAHNYVPATDNSPNFAYHANARSDSAHYVRQDGNIKFISNGMMSAAAYATRRATYTITNAYTDMVWDTQPISAKSFYSTSTGEYTAQVTGLHEISGVISVTAPAAGSTTTVELFTNGADGGQLNKTHVGTGNDIIPFHFVANITAGQKFKIRVKNTTGALVINFASGSAGDGLNNWLVKVLM